MAQLELPTGTWQIDTAHSSVNFSVRHMMVAKVRGRFNSFSGTITVGDDQLASSVEASIDVDSLETRDDSRDAHLRSPDFFDAASFPTMTFRSTSVRSAGDEYELVGDLTIKDVTRPVTLDLEVGGSGRDPWGNTRVGFSARGEINRKDFGLTWNAPLETGGVLVGDKVTIELDVEAVHQAAAAAPEAAA
jgi:polyisoprenoid-binding protein YceI